MTFVSSKPGEKTADLEAEDLIQEAHEHKRRRRLFVVAATSLLIAAGLLSYIASGTRGGQPASTARRPSHGDSAPTTNSLKSLAWSCTYSSPAPRYPLAAPPQSDVTVQQRICFGPDMPKMFRGGNPTQVRLSIPTRNGRKLGPVVMAFNDLSNLKLFIAYGPDSVWIYSPSTTSGSLLLRFSDRSGKLLKAVHMPPLALPYGYANATGVWIADGQSGTSPLTNVVHVSLASKSAVLLRNQPLPTLPHCGATPSCVQEF